jgi:hypothetical protein
VPVPYGHAIDFEQFALEEQVMPEGTPPDPPVVDPPVPLLLAGHSVPQGLEGQVSLVGQ